MGPPFFQSTHKCTFSLSEGTGQRVQVPLVSSPSIGLPSFWCRTVLAAAPCHLFGRLLAATRRSWPWRGGLLKWENFAKWKRKQRTKQKKKQFIASHGNWKRTTTTVCNKIQFVPSISHHFTLWSAPASSMIHHLLRDIFQRVHTSDRTSPFLKLLHGLLPGNPTLPSN